MKRKLILALSLFAACTFSRLAAADGISTSTAVAGQVPANSGTVISVDPADRLHPVDRKFFGANSLFWVDDDAALANPAYEKLLREAKVGLLRFPGGEVADNYHWKTNTLDDPSFYPGRDGDKCTDTDEFMPWCRRIGAEPIVVVNLDSSVMAGNIKAGVQEAADWVRYCNIEKKYNIRYWEIGNEAYLKVTRHSFTATEYAAAVTSFSTAMKAVDPTIQIGAVGPAYPDDFVPFDKLLPGYLEAARKPVHKAPRLAAYDEALQHGEKSNPNKWWPTVCSLARNDFDFAVVHQYTPSGTYAELSRKKLNQDRKLSRLRDGLNAMAGKTIPIALTEWNVSPEAALAEHEQAMVATDLAFDYMRAGVSMANFWPLHSPLPKKKTQPTYRAMISANPPVARPFYYYFKALSVNSLAHIVKAATTSAATSAVATASDDGGQLTLFILNKQTSEAAVRVALPPSYHVLGAEVLQAAHRDSPSVQVQSLQYQQKMDDVFATLPAMSLVVAKFRKQAEK